MGMENYISRIDDQRLLSICSIIPASDFKTLFTSNSQKFNKIKGGYNYRRATPENTYSFAIRNKDEEFISHFINWHIEQLLESVHNEIRTSIEDGLREEEALVVALSHTVFNGDVQLFFELENRPFTPEYISMIEYALRLRNKNCEITTAFEASQELHKQGNDELESQKREIERLQQSLTDTQALYARQEEEMSAMTKELERLRGLSRYVTPAENYEPLQGYMYLSLCRAYTDENGKSRLERLAGITNDGEIMSGLLEEAPDRKFIYNTSGPTEEGFVGVWSWRATPNSNDPNRLYFESRFDNRFIPVEVLVIEACNSVADLIKQLDEGFEYHRKSRRIMIACNNGAAFEGLLCDMDLLVNASGTYTVSPSVFKLPLFEFQKQDLVPVDGATYLRYLYLGMPVDEVAIKDTMEIVRSILVQRITKRALTPKGYYWNDVRQMREFIDNIPTDGLLDEIAKACDCSLEQAEKLKEQFIKWAETEFDGKTLDDSVIARVIRNNAELREMCCKALREEWEAQNAVLLEEARADLSTVRDEEAACRRTVETRKKEASQLDAEIAEMRSKLSEQQQLAEDVEHKVSERIELARRNAAEFIAENAFVHINTAPVVQPGTESAMSAHSIARFTEGAGLDSEELDVNDSWKDVLLTIQSELEEAGVAKDKVVGLSGFMYSAYLNRIPLLLAGPNGAEIARAFSIAINGITPSKLRCSGEYQQAELGKCETAASDVVVIEHPFQHEWYSEVLELFARRKQFYIAIHPFAEDLAIEPKGILNYCVPVMTDTFVDSAPSMNYLGGRMSDSFSEFKRERTASKYKDLLSVFGLSSYARSTIQSLMSDILQMVPDAAVESDYLYILYPLAYVLGKTAELCDFIDSCAEGTQPPRTIREIIGERSGAGND